MKAVVEFRQAAKRYGRHQALSPLNLALQPGEVLGLLGHNGAGKTTTIKLILGAIAATQGAVYLFGQSPRGVQGRRLRRRVGYLPESVAFYDHLTGRETLRYLGRLKGSADAQVEVLLRQVGLAEAAGRRVKSYSKGMRQRLGLAQALLGEPQLLLLDEPTVGLDPLATREFYATVQRLRDQGVTIVLCSHVLPGIERYVDRVAILGLGQLLAEGTLATLREQAQLPLLVRVRGALPETLAQQIAAAEPTEGWSLRRLCCQRIEIFTAPRDKLTLLRLLSRAPWVEDIELEPPSLETLYAHFSQQTLESA